MKERSELTLVFAGLLGSALLPLFALRGGEEWIPALGVVGLSLCFRRISWRAWGICLLVLGWMALGKGFLLLWHGKTDDFVHVVLLVYALGLMGFAVFFSTDIERLVRALGVYVRISPAVAVGLFVTTRSLSQIPLRAKILIATRRDFYGQSDRRWPRFSEYLHVLSYLLYDAALETQGLSLSLKSRLPLRFAPEAPRLTRRDAWLFFLFLLFLLGMGVGAEFVSFGGGFT